jgi:addiction module HigA family antidote
MANTLRVSRKTLSKIINKRGAITPDMALRLARAFDTTPDLWLNLQKNYDLWQAEHRSKEWRQVKPLSPQLLHSNI